MSGEALRRMAGLRIAHLIETDGPGGAERLLAHLTAELAAAGCDGVVFLPYGGEGWLSRELRSAGVPVEYYRLERPLSPGCARQLVTSFRRHGIALAHSHEFTMAVYGSWGARLAGIPHLITMHGSTYYAGRARRRLALRVAFALSGSLVAVSRQLADRLSADLWIPRRRVHTILNGVRPAPAWPSTLRAELGLGPTDRLLVAVGNLYPVKGHRYLLEALANLRSRHPTVHLAIAGRGEERESLLARAQSLGLDGRVHLLGLRSDVPNVLAGADIFVLPSVSEGLPLALLEAMFAGLPIVASRVGEIPAVLEHGADGVLVEPGDAAALSQALDRLLDHPLAARRLGVRAARRAAAEYHISRTVARYADLYQHLLTKAPTPRS